MIEMYKKQRDTAVERALHYQQKCVKLQFELDGLKARKSVSFTSDPSVIPQREYYSWKTPSS
jgi:hypothetical protein